MKAFWYLDAGFLLMGLISLVIGGSEWYNQKILHENLVETEGTVAPISSGNYDKSLVEFTTKEGKEFHIVVKSTPKKPYREGEKITVFYDPAAPYKAQVEHIIPKWDSILMFVGIGAIFSLVGGISLLSYRRKQKVRDWLQSNGMSIQAKFKEVVYDTDITINYEHNPWRLRCEWLHPATYKPYLFESDPIWYDPTPRLKSDKLNVLINFDNPNQYLVDISFLPSTEFPHRINSIERSYSIFSYRRRNGGN